VDVGWIGLRQARDMAQGQADPPALRDGVTGRPGVGPPSVPGVCALARLDGGGLSEVYRGRCTRTGNGVVVKVLPTPFDRDTRAEFDLDRTRLGRLRHVPSILQVDDVEVLPDGRPYLVTELCTDSLAESIARGQRLSAGTVAAHGEQAATALAAAHQAGIVHGGVSPRNVLFRRSGQLALSDFGLTLRQHYPGDPEGSTEYLAPETLRDGTLTERSDLYALGATLYAALTGRPPFPLRVGEHPSERILRVLSQPAPRAGDDLPAGLAELLAELLAGDPADRPVDARAVITRFADLAGPLSEPVHSDLDPAPAAGADSAPGDLAVEDEASTDWSGLLDDTLYEPEPGSGTRWARTVPEPVIEPAAERPPRPDFPAAAGAGPPPGNSPRRRRTTGVLATVVAGLVLLVLLPRLSQAMGVGNGQPAPRRPAARTATGAPVAAPVSPAGVQLAAVRDRGQAVELTWRGASSLEYAVVVAGAGLPTRAVLAHHALSIRLPISPDRQYCFIVQATDGRQVLQTAPRAIRGAVCRL